MAIIEVSGRKYQVGASWYPLDSKAQLTDRIRTEDAFGVVLSQGKEPSCLGLCKSEESAPLAAAVLALTRGQSATLAIEPCGIDGYGEPIWWVGAVIPGSTGPVVILDAILSEVSARMELRQLPDLDDFLWVGSGASHFRDESRQGGEVLEWQGGQGMARFWNAPERKAIPRKLGGGYPLREIGLACVAILFVAGSVVWLFADDLFGPEVDLAAAQRAEERAAAIRARNASLSSFLSAPPPRGMGAMLKEEEGNWGVGGPGWQFSRLMCQGSSCVASWKQVGPRAVPEDMARRLGVSRSRLQHDLRGEWVSLSEAVRPPGIRVTATEQTSLEDLRGPLVDVCKRIQGLHVDCRVQEPQSAPGLSRDLPQSLHFKVGSVTIKGPMGLMDPSLSIIDVLHRRGVGIDSIQSSHENGSPSFEAKLTYVTK